MGASEEQRSSSAGGGRECVRRGTFAFLAGYCIVCEKELKRTIHGRQCTWGQRLAETTRIDVWN
jgi:hypothetical protein